MRYNFKDILNEDIYNNSRVVLITGKYNIFNNMVADTLKDLCGSKQLPNAELIDMEEEFGVDDGAESTSNSVDFETFMELANIPSINGKRFCRLELGTLNKKQKEAFGNYLKQPSRYGILVLISSNFNEYKDYLKNRYFSNGQYTHMFSLSYPRRDILKSIVQMMFNDKGKEIDSTAIDYFVMRMSTEYDEYERVIDNIVERHEDNVLKYADIKEYMKGIEYFDIDDFMIELVKPLSSGKTGNKKIVRMLQSLKEKYDAENLVRELLKRISELLDFRVLINSGIIPIELNNYIYADVINEITKKYDVKKNTEADTKNKDDKNYKEQGFMKYTKMNEYVFRNRAELAKMTSLKDWIYMKIMLSEALTVGFPDTLERRHYCERTLYMLIMRTTFCESRINNDLGIENSLYRNRWSNLLDRVVWDSALWNKIDQEQSEVYGEDYEEEISEQPEQSIRYIADDSEYEEDDDAEMDNTQEAVNDLLERMLSGQIQA